MEKVNTDKPMQKVQKSVAKEQGGTTGDSKKSVSSHNSKSDKKSGY